MDDPRDYLRYDSDTGKFYWTRTIERRYTAGKEAGGITPHGYVRISINYQWYYAHRLAFLFMTGSNPINIIDHIDRDGTNNRWNNLREVSHNENLHNSCCKSNTSGYKGVSFDKRTGKWRAYISFNGKRYEFGKYINMEDAINGRREGIKNTSALRRLWKLGCT